MVVAIRTAHVATLDRGPVESGLAAGAAHEQPFGHATLGSARHGESRILAVGHRLSILAPPAGRAPRLAVLSQRTLEGASSSFWRTPPPNPLPAAERGGKKHRPLCSPS